MHGTMESLYSNMTSVEETIKTSVAKLEKRFDEIEKEWEEERAALTPSRCYCRARNIYKKEPLPRYAHLKSTSLTCTTLGLDTGRSTT